MFKWVALAVGTVIGAAVLVMVNDLRLQAKRTARTVNEQLPQILEKSNKTADTVVLLSEDIRQLRNLAGAPDGARDRTLAAYADRVLDAIQSSGGMIGTKRLARDELKDPVPAAEWVVGARKEALVLTLRARSREELMAGLVESWTGSDWHMQVGKDKPVPLRQWVEAHVARDEPATRPGTG